MIDLNKILVFNFAVIALFAVFGYYIGKWWIMFFSILFLEHPKIYIINSKTIEEEDDLNDE